MTGLRSRLLQWAARAIEPNDRAAFMGDLTESGAGLLESLSSIAGLVLRRQVGLWHCWQPWLALVGIAGVTAFFLSRSVFFLDAGLEVQLRTYLHHGVRYEMGVSAAQDLFSLVIQFLAILFWAWTSGFLLTYLSGRSAWLTGIFFYVVVCTSWYAHHLLFDQIRQASGGYRAPVPLLLVLLLTAFTPAKAGVLLAAVWGGIVALRKHAQSSMMRIVLAATAAGLIFLLLWSGNWYEEVKPALSNGAWQPEPWADRLLPIVAMSWPAAYLAAFRFTRTVRT